jgi:3-methyladenine DNA glycosylase/8-oxoguanine DNA glycosylase
MASAAEQAYRLEVARGVEHLRARDKRLGRFIDRYGSCEMPWRRMPSPFSALLRAIVFQQLAGKAAEAIHGRVLGLWGGRHARPNEVHGTPIEKLRAAGLSQAKALAVLDLSAKAIDGVVTTRSRLLRLSDEAVIERLTAVRGVGRWTVEMLLMFDLGRLDVLPTDDYGVRKGFGSLYRKGELPTPKELAAHGERWRPYRSVASWYLWRAAESKPAKS